MRGSRDTRRAERRTGLATAGATALATAALVAASFALPSGTTAAPGSGDPGPALARR